MKGGMAMKNKKQSKQPNDLTQNVGEPETKKIKKDLDKKKVEGNKQKKRSRWTQKYFKKFVGRHQDSYDTMTQADYDYLLERACELSSISVNDYETLILITVPDAFEKNGQVHYRLDKKEDGTHSLRYDQALVTVLFFGHDTLYYHQANVDHRNGHIGFDVAGEFNYFDVVYVETSLKYDNNDKPKYITLDIKVVLSDGTKIPFHLRNHRIHDNYHLDTLLTSTEQKVLQTLKTKIRESKKA